MQLEFQTYGDVFLYIAKHLISKLLTHDRTKRLGCLKDGAKDVMNHKWFNTKDGWTPEDLMALTPPHVPQCQSDHDVTHFDDYSDSIEDKSVELSGKDKECFKEIFGPSTE